MVGQSARIVYEIDEVAMTATMIREIKQPRGLASGGLGSASFADDGSVFINWGAIQPMFIEVDADDNTLLSITSSIGTFRANKLARTELPFTIEQLRAATGGALIEP